MRSTRLALPVNLAISYTIQSALTIVWKARILIYHLGLALCVLLLVSHAQARIQLRNARHAPLAILPSRMGAMINVLRAITLIKLITLANVSIFVVLTSIVCHSACNICYGSSSKQCYNCTEMYSVDELGDTQKVGYLLQGTSCIIPKCIEG